MRIRTLPLVMVLVVASRMPAGAGTVVDPGVGTLQAAIDAAAPGDSLLLNGGTYVGPVVVSKPLRITCLGECMIDANCEAPVALDIAADGVRLRSKDKTGVLQVFRGTHTQIRIANRRKIELRTHVVATKLFLSSCGTEQVGIEVSGTSSKVKLLDVRAIFLEGPGLLLSGLAPRSGVKVSRFIGTDNGVGIAVENSAVGAGLGKSGIDVDRAVLVDNDVAIRVVGSDGLRVKRALVVANEDRIGLIGISLDAASNRALVLKSDWNDRSGTGDAYVDAGTGTCGKNNDGFDVPACQ
jgi:nitrous oxidase accessory protein NosD